MTALPGCQQICSNTVVHSTFDSCLVRYAAAAASAVYTKGMKASYGLLSQCYTGMKHSKLHILHVSVLTANQGDAAATALPIATAACP